MTARMRMTMAVACGVWSVGFVGLSGCRGTLEAIDLPKDLTVTIAPDQAGMPPDDDGGTTVHFNPSIEADINMNSCASGSTCHQAGTTPPAGSPVVLVLNPTAMADLMTNYNSIKSVATPAGNPAMTTLMQTVSGAVKHTGGALITATGTPDEYNRWIAWIQGGTQF